MAGTTRSWQRRYVSSAFFVLNGVVLTLGLLFYPICRAIPWPEVFNVSSPQAVAEAGPASAVFVGCMLIGVPLALVNLSGLAIRKGSSATSGRLSVAYWHLAASCWRSSCGWVCHGWWPR